MKYARCFSLGHQRKIRNKHMITAFQTPVVPRRNGVMADFERLFGGAYSVREKYFYVLLRELCQSKQSSDEWLLLNDTAKGRSLGFASYGLSARVCKAARRKLKQDGLIECRYVHGTKGQRIGTGYRLLDGKFETNAKTVHAAIMRQFGDGVIHSAPDRRMK
jgi:hypothetical protein